MEKTATLNLRVNPTVKEQAENVLEQLGIPMSTAINMYLTQIALTESIPFNMTLRPPKSIDPSQMSDEELFAKFQRGYEDAKAGRGTSAEEFFKKFFDEH